MKLARELDYHFRVSDLGLKTELAKRLEMVGYLHHVFPLTFGRKLNRQVAYAMEMVPRHACVPDAAHLQGEAYDNYSLPLGMYLPQENRGKDLYSVATVSEPGIVALMTQLTMEPLWDRFYDQELRVAVLGGGSGYQTAVLAEAGAKVTSVELHKELWEQGRKNLQTMDYLKRVEWLLGDGFGILSEKRRKEKFHAIMVPACILLNGAGFRALAKLTEVIAPGGVLVHVRKGVGEQELVVRHVGERGWAEEFIGTVQFVPAIT